MLVKPGLRLRSAVCGAEVIIVRTAEAELDLRCGGEPMLPFDATAPGGTTALASGLDQGILLGKRYGADDLEILCTKPGKGTLSIGDEPLPVLEPKKLPSSD
jgi:hypothetical protein